MRKSTRNICLSMLAGFFMLLGAGAFALDEPYNRIQILERTPVIDGVITPGEWPGEQMVRLSRAFHPEHAIRLYFAHDRNNLYLGAYVEDANLWADGNGGGSGNLWETWNDDGIAWYFDPNLSRDNHLTSTDRFLALNIAPHTAPVNGGGAVSRRELGNGFGNGGTTGLGEQIGTAPGITYAVHHYGSVNLSSDLDTGYSMEVSVPWNKINRTAPQDGELMGINVALLFDDDGGTHDWNHQFAEVAYGPTRFLPNGYAAPALIDEYVELRWGTQTTQQGGPSGPVNYQVAQFHAGDDVMPPGPVESLYVGNLRPFSADISWVCPGDNREGAAGVSSGFDVRFGTSPMDEANFASAVKWPLETHPPAPASVKKIRVMGLSPETTYYFAVRAFDEAGNKGPLTLSPPVTTPAPSAVTAADPEQYRGAVRLAPGGRYFMTEDGGQFIPVGDHLLVNNDAIRHLYDGEIWNGSRLMNLSKEEGAMDKVIEYLDRLKENGITVMRLFIPEFSTPPMNNGPFNAENGAYWYEFPRGNYNPAMDKLLVDLLRLCSQRGIYLALSPFETYYFRSHFDQTIWSSLNGGPLTHIDQFYNNPETLQICKDRWTHMIGVIRNSGYADAIFGYEVMVEWDSWYWTRPSSDVAGDGRIRIAFVEALARHIKALDPDHLIVSNTITNDPRGPVATLAYYNDLFDVTCFQGYTASAIHPWENPALHKEPTLFREHSRVTAWWSSNQLGRKPFFNTEWGPDHVFMPAYANASYFDLFTEEEDDRMARVLWFTELCSGAAGPGRRLPMSVRAFERGSFLSDNMLQTMKTIGNFVENGSANPVFDFRDFPSENIRGQIRVENTGASVLVTGCSDGRKGLAYLLQDFNVTSGMVGGALLTIQGLKTTATELTAEFWGTGPDISAPSHFVKAAVNNGNVSFPIPDFSEDWAVRFYGVEAVVPVPVSTVSVSGATGEGGGFQEGDSQMLSISSADIDRTVSAYIALAYPDNSFRCIGPLLKLEEKNAIVPVVTGAILPDIPERQVFELDLEDLSPGTYTWYFILADPDVKNAEWRLQATSAWKLLE